MNKATELLQKARIFYVSTVDGDQAHVRPFGAVAEFDGKTYICMSNQKKVYNQLLANPKLEIAAATGGMTWFRITAKANRDDRQEARAKMLEALPNLASMYKPDDGIYEVFYLSDVTIEEY